MAAKQYEQRKTAGVKDYTFLLVQPDGFWDDL